MFNILSFNDFLNEDNIPKVVAPKDAPAVKTAQEISKLGLNFTNKLKVTEAQKPAGKHMPCYQYVYSFIKNFIPKLNPAIMNDFKMAYKKDITSLQSAESIKLAQNSLHVPTIPDTMKGLEYANSKYHMGNIVAPAQAKIGDAISFWVYEFIEFSTKEKNFSFPDTAAKFDTWVKKNKVDLTKLPEWLIEGAVLKYGHYGVISDIDANYLYLTSSGEKKGINGIWNGVEKGQCEENFTKILKSDLIKFQNMSYNDFIFKATDQLSNRRTRLVLRSYILNFIK